MSIEDLIVLLRLKFPGIVICGTTAEFYDDDSEGLWVSGEEGDHNDRQIFDYYNDVEEVEPEVEKFLSDNGFFAEPNDPGTYMIWRT